MSAIEIGGSAVEDAFTQRNHLGLEVGDPDEIRAERDGLERTISHSIREQNELRDELAEREPHTSAA